MSDDKQKNSNAPESRGGGNVWLVLIAIVSAVLLSAFLFGNADRQLRYPDLMGLLKMMAEAKQAEAVTDPSALTSDLEQAASASESNAAEASKTPSLTQGPVETDESKTASETKTDLASDGQAKPDAENPSSKKESKKAPAVRIVVSSAKNPEAKIEYSGLEDILVSDGAISGKVMYRSLGIDGKGPSGEPKLMDFTTIRDTNNQAEHTRLVEYLNASGVTWDNARPSRLLQDHWPELLMIGVLIFLGIIMLRRIGGVGSPMSFSRSRGKLYGQEDLAITFEDAAGIDEAVEEVREVVDFLKNSEKYQALGGRIPKGVLLVGPPGTGKTLLAKAIAGEAGVPFFSLSGSDFVEMYVGVGAARVRDMFQQATSRAPCIIFIDELDALGKSRSGSTVGGHDEREQTLNALLVEIWMDSIRTRV